MTVMASIWTAHVRAASASLLPVSRLSEALELLLQNPLFSHFHVLCFFFFSFNCHFSFVFCCHQGSSFVGWASVSVGINNGL